MKIAIVHDYLNQYGGAEKVVETLHDVFPDAPIYTSIYIPENMPECFKKMDVRTSFMQKLPFLNKHFKKYLMIYSKAIESFDLSGYDVVLSSSSAFAKGARVGSETLHICYCYSPMRFVWNYESYVEKEEFGAVTRKMLPFFISRLKKRDLRTNGGVNHFIAISRSIQDRIRQCYQLDSDIIYPPVNVGGFEIAKEVSDYFLIVSRLNAYKRIDLAIEAFNRLGLPLKIIGDGPYRRNLERMTGPNIEFLGKVPADILAEKYSRCRALIFPGDEDFGIVPVEAQACGRPVIAYAAGGALETVIENVTGVFFRTPSAHALMDAVEQFRKTESCFNPAQIRSNSFRFDEVIFKREIKCFIEKKHHEFQRSDK